MNQLLGLPIEVRLLFIFVTGLLLGGQINRGIYRLAWNPRNIGPWSPPDRRAPPRRWWDRIPVLGWLSLRRESTLHGPGFWIRPMLIELATGASLAGLYWFEVAHRAQVPFPKAAVSLATLHAQYFSHVVLISLMLIATFIDFDEQTIPDSITVPGTLAGLWFAALLPSSRPLTLALPIPNVEFLHVGSPEAWPAWLDHWPGLMMGLGCFLAWWLAIVPATWTTRRGLSKAWLYFWVSFWRRLSALLLAIVFLGTVAVLGAWLAGRDSWQSLFSALVGVAFGGGLIWAVRIIGSRALGQEAMGFGDVTLMAMIGAFAGWQATLIVFFLAPFAAVLISVTQWLLTRRKDIAFGPYLCLAEVYLIVRWKPIWNESARQIFSLGWIIPLLVAVCLVLMGGMLWGMRLVRHRAAAAQLPETDTLAADSAAAVDLPIRGPSAPAGRTVGSDRRHKT